MYKNKIKKGDTVKVITGKFAGATGLVTKVMPKVQRCIVENVTICKKHKKATSAEDNSGIIDVPCAIHISNVAYYDNDDKIISKIGYKKNDDGKKVRFLKKTQKVLND